MFVSPKLSDARVTLFCMTLFIAGTIGIEAKEPNYLLDDAGMGSRKNSLSKNAIQSLRSSFIGREFVMRINWNANHLIHEGQVMHASETFAGASAQRKASKKGVDFGPLVSPAGEVSTIVGMNFQHANDVYLHFRTGRGTIGSLVVRSPGKKKSSFEKWDDQILTPNWLEMQLNNQAVRFLKKSSVLNANAVQATLPQAQSGLQLSVNPDESHGEGQAGSHSLSHYAIYLESLSVRAEPEKVRKGEYVKLIIEYTIAGDSDGVVDARESRHLNFADKSLPGYPVVKTFSREIGISESSYRQRIPSSAKRGTYFFKGEVVINGEMISRNARFTVVD